MSKWISAQDALPGKYQPVLGLFGDDGDCVAVVVVIDGVFVKDTFQAELYGTEGLTGISTQPTHWMPLLDPQND